jgi:hypothetical protein
MTATRHEITRDDILPIERYARERKARRARLVEVKKHRRVPVGPDWARRRSRTNWPPIIP